MAFFTSQQLFGNGSGSPGGAGWVPIELAAPPTYSANNRGIAFGEQLTSAIANRSHYALALNTDDLNTRLALFETEGLDAPYRLGASAVAGGGRVITKDGGAVETVSALASILDDDIANAHFRANQIGDAVRGGGGFDAVGYGRSGASSLFGYLDRRAVNFAGYSVVADSIAVTIVGAAITVGAGQLKDGSGNTHVMLGYDFIELLTGVHAGVYVITALPSGTACTVVNLDGTTPAFAAGASTARMFRTTFGSFNRWGQTGTHLHQGGIFAGTPGMESALDLVAGSTLGRYDTVLSSPDGARHALRVIWKSLLGAPSTRLTIDSQGQVQSYVSSLQLTAAQLTAAQGFGAPAFVVQQDASNQLEVGYYARSNGAMTHWLGAAVMGDARPATTPAGSFAFNFINVPPYNVDLTDTTAADWMLSPSVTLIEIMTPTPQAGVYRVVGRDVNNGRLELAALDTGAVAVAFPGAGAGTLRVLYGTSLGARDVDLGSALFSGATSTSRAAAVISAPKQVGGVALLLEAGNQNAVPPNHYFLRAVSADDGISTEKFAIDSAGRVAGSSFQAGSTTDGFVYETAPSRTIIISLRDANSTLDTSSTPVQHWSFDDQSGFVYWEAQVANRDLIVPLNSYLREGMIITNIQAIVDPGEARATVGNRIDMKLRYVTPDFVTPGSNPVAYTTIANEADDGTAAPQIISLATDLGAGHTVSRSARDYFLMIQSGNTVVAQKDYVLGIRIVVTDPGPRNN